MAGTTSDGVAPFAPRALHPLRSYYGTVRPFPVHRCFHSSRMEPLVPFPFASLTRFSRYEQDLIELRAVYMLDAVWAVSGHPQADPEEGSPPGSDRLIRFRHIAHDWVDRLICLAGPAPSQRAVFALVFAQCPLGVCAVKRRRFPVGASPTRRSLQPEATGAGMEVTKCLKPSDSGSRNTVTARVCRPQVNAEQASKRTMCRPTPVTLPGKADTAG